VGRRIRSSTAPKHSDPRPRFGSGVDSHLGPVRKPRAGAAGENRFASTDGSRHAPAPWKTHSTAKLRSAMETFKDYYRTLRVRPTADDVTIKAASRAQTPSGRRQEQVRRPPVPEHSGGTRSWWILRNDASTIASIATASRCALYLHI